MKQTQIFMIFIGVSLLFMLATCKSPVVGTKGPKGDTGESGQKGQTGQIGVSQNTTTARLLEIDTNSGAENTANLTRHTDGGASGKEVYYTLDEGDDSKSFRFKAEYEQSLDSSLSFNHYDKDGDMQNGRPDVSIRLKGDWIVATFERGKKGFYILTSETATRKENVYLLVGDVPIPFDALIVDDTSFKSKSSDEGITNAIPGDASFDLSKLQEHSDYNRTLTLTTSSNLDGIDKDFILKAKWNRNRFPFGAPTPKGIITYSSEDSSKLTINPTNGKATIKSKSSYIDVLVAISRAKPYASANNILLYDFIWR